MIWTEMMMKCKYEIEQGTANVQKIQMFKNTNEQTMKMWKQKLNVNNFEQRHGQLFKTTNRWTNNENVETKIKCQ